MRFLFFILLITSLPSWGQSKNKSQGRSFGVGVQVFEPTGINVQSFRGFFNDNNSSFATRGVWELGVGKENILGISDQKEYATGNWTKGGVRVDMNYFYPLITVHYPFVFQFYVGGGLQTGTRLYTSAGKEESNFATGGNLLARIELVTHGIDMGRSVWFLSVYSDIKFHSDFTESFDYVSPVVGVRMRKGR
jgi:hypothetical protein